MFGSFRAAMTWLHTWFGLVLGFVLMVVFFFGSLSVFGTANSSPGEFAGWSRLMASLLNGLVCTLCEIGSEDLTSTFWSVRTTSTCGA